ncbi:MAG: ParB/RepB/Spo0J family partition protein [Flavobacteriaceae bacterium]
MAKSAKKMALGKGLSAILNDPDLNSQSTPNTATKTVIGNVIEIPLERITENPFQPRTNFNEEKLRELATSIRELGVVQPITVREIEPNNYQLVAGERRFRASKSIQLKTIPAFVRTANDQESLEMALVENIQRQDLDPIEIALSYQRLIDDINLTQNQLSERVGKKRSSVTNYLRLLKLDPIIQTGMRDGFVSMGHGRALINIEDPNVQLGIYEKIISKGLSVRATEELVKKTKSEPEVFDLKEPAPPVIEAGWLASFQEFFDKGVKIKANPKGKGSIQIPFDSLDTLQSWVEKIKK